MTPSNSSSSTGPSQGQPTQLYTTAGTVYNPGAVVPLQPPTRKGRTSRWPPPSQGELALLNKSAPSGYSYRRSPPTTASSLKHYSPLQQNSARAIDPSTVANPLNRSTSDSSSSVSITASNPRANITGLDKSNGQSRNMGLQYEDKEEDELSSLSNLGVKGLTSLASYPNAHQQMAQRALDKARETVKAAESSRPMSPTSRQDYQRPQEGTSALQSSTTPSQDYGDYHGRFPKTGHVVGSTRSSVLSSGPGAPRPLTAGPPGQRQYRAATLEGASRAFQSDTKQASSTIDETHFDINPATLISLGRTTTSKMSSRPQTPFQTEQLPTKSSSILGRQPLHDAFAPVQRPDLSRRPGRTRDTLPVEPLRQYFPDGFPSDYHYEPNPAIVLLPQGAGLTFQEGRYLPTLEEVTLRDARSRAAFYSPCGEIVKTFDERITDARNKLLGMELGVDVQDEHVSAPVNKIYSLPQFGKPNYEFTTEFANELPTHEAATPLISMAFSTLLNYWDNGRLMPETIPTGFEKIVADETGLRDQGKDSKIGELRHH
ncbi:hypothetical protein VPNG_02691 [Cytospora leucostoma]|uniref:Uncharacterized protein n=1 Tax=Cytospora leucostoma TaxID=1230097 RepID=A0A423XJW2_9PEZI|nr:hypothetical protein VPNG_02691 [Cytospora leucostoma]